MYVLFSPTFASRINHILLRFSFFSLSARCGKTPRLGPGSCPLSLYLNYLITEPGLPTLFSLLLHILQSREYLRKVRPHFPFWLYVILRLTLCSCAALEVITSSKTRASSVRSILSSLTLFDYLLEASTVITLEPATRIAH